MTTTADLTAALLRVLFAPDGAPLPFESAVAAAVAVDGWDLSSGGFSSLTLGGEPAPILIDHNPVRALLAAAAGDALDDTTAESWPLASGRVLVGRTADYGGLIGFSAPAARVGAVQPLTQRRVVTDSTISGGGVEGSPLGVVTGVEPPPGRLEVSSMDEVLAQIMLTGEDAPVHGPDFEYAERLLDTVRAIYTRRMKPEALSWAEVSLAASMTVARLYSRREAPLGVATADGVMRVMRDPDLAMLLDGAWKQVM